MLNYAVLKDSDNDMLQHEMTTLAEAGYFFVGVTHSGREIVVIMAKRYGE